MATDEGAGDGEGKLTDVGAVALTLTWLWLVATGGEIVLNAAETLPCGRFCNSLATALISDDGTFC